MDNEEERSLPIIKNTGLSRFQKCREKKRKKNDQMRDDLELIHIEAAERKRENEDLQETNRKHREQLEETLDEKDELTTQVQELTNTIGIHLTTIDNMKAELRNAKQRDDNHEAIRDQIIKGWIYSLTLKVVVSNTWRSKVHGVELGESLIFTEDSRPKDVSDKIRFVMFKGKVNQTHA